MGAKTEKILAKLKSKLLQIIIIIIINNFQSSCQQYWRTVDKHKYMDSGNYTLVTTKVKT
jgi:ABC-type sulfate transport system permease component